MDLKCLADLATIVGAVGGIGALGFAGYQLRKTLDVERGRFMLELQRMVDDHDVVHLKLRPGGVWADGVTGPATAGELVELEDYLAFFEHCEILLESGSLELSSFKTIFGYRIVNILRNQAIVAKLLATKEEWQKFRALTERLGLDWPTPPAASSAHA